MANGNNTAKQIVIDQANGHAKSLENGGAEDIKTIGRAVGLLTKMVVSIYQCDFVTVEECKRLHAVRVKEVTKIKIGPIEYSGHITSAFIVAMIPTICCGVLLYVLGKSQNWW